MASPSTSDGLAPIVLNGHGEAGHDEKHEEVPQKLSSNPASLTDDEGAGGQGESVATDDEEEDEEDDEEEEEEEDEDEEPSLKYERIGGSLSDLLKKDSGSAITVCNKQLVHSSNSGILRVLTPPAGNGYTRRDNTHPRPHRQAHKIIQTPPCIRSRHLIRRDRRFRRHCVH
jgi:hypothetical protein